MADTLIKRRFTADDTTVWRRSASCAKTTAAERIRRRDCRHNGRLATGARCVVANHCDSRTCPGRWRRGDRLAAGLSANGIRGRRASSSALATPCGPVADFYAARSSRPGTMVGASSRSLRPRTRVQSRREGAAIYAGAEDVPTGVWAGWTLRDDYWRVVDTHLTSEGDITTSSTCRRGKIDCAALTHRNA